MRSEIPPHVKGWKVKGGYKVITPIKILNAVSSYQKGQISFKALRIYFACFELMAIREAAARSSSVLNGKGRGFARFKREELTRLSGLSNRSTGTALSELKKAKLLIFSDNEITVTEMPLKGAGELLKNHFEGRKGTRPVPVPRRLLRHLATTRRPAFFLTVLGYILRGLSLKKRTGEINSRGTVKASWLSEVFGISIRAVKASRAEMIALGLIERDTASYQRKMNRDGSYFVLNLEWEGTSVEAKPVDNFSENDHESAPPEPQKCTEFAPPIKRLKTSYEVKNQKTQRTEPSGVLKQEPDKKIPPPNIRNVRREDLFSASRNEVLYFQAIEAGFISRTEADLLNWIAVSIRARETENPEKIFSGILRKKLFHFITHEQEDRARRALNKRRETHPLAFRYIKEEPLAA